MGYRMPSANNSVTGTFYCTKSRAPSKHQYFSFCRTVINFLFRNIISNLVYFLLPDLHHQLMILRIITYITCNVLFFQSTNPMFKSWCAGYCPWTSQFFITLDKAVIFLHRAPSSVLNFTSIGRQICCCGKLPWLCTIGNITIT